MTLTSKTLWFVGGAMVAFSLSFSLVANATWTTAPSNPPTGNSSAPLNVGSTAQTKNGNLIVNGFSATALCLPGSAPTGGCISTWPSGGTSQWAGTSPGSIYYNNGNVGIGTNNPLALLHLKATAAQFRFESTAVGAGNSALLNFAAAGAGKFFFGLDGDLSPTSDKLAIYDYSVGTYTTVWSGGNVGIGTNSPASKLDVTGNVNVTGSVTAGSFLYSSDARLKKNVAAIASSTALQDILALQPVTYNWIDPQRGTGNQIGFIAQQVESVVPELVATNASTTLKAVDYARMAPLLVGAVQAQQAQLDAQQKEIDALKAEVDALKAGK